MNARPAHVLNPARSLPNRASARKIAPRSKTMGNQEVEMSDVIVVLSGDNYGAERAIRAASLFKSGMAPRVVATGRALRSYATTTATSIR